MRPRLATPGNILYNREKITLRGEGRREKGTTRMKKIGMLLALLALLMAALPEALAETVTYLDENGEKAQHEAQPFEPTNLQNEWTIGEVGQIKWYYLRGELDLSKFLSVDGYVHLILEDGAKLTAQDGIRLFAGSGSSNTDATLTIYAQSQGESMGQIIATGNENFSGIFVHTNSTLTINGGYVKATGGSKGGAGIGGRASYAGDIMYDCGTVIINGGVVIAQGSDGGSGIGGGIMLGNATGDINYGG